MALRRAVEDISRCWRHLPSKLKDLKRRRRRDGHSSELDAAPDTPLAHEIGVQAMRQCDARDRRTRPIAVGKNLALNSAL